VSSEKTQGRCRSDASYRARYRRINGELRITDGMNSRSPIMAPTIPTEQRIPAAVMDLNGENSNAPNPRTRMMVPATMGRAVLRKATPAESSTERPSLTAFLRCVK
jgi:hypothetical protein